MPNVSPRPQGEMGPRKAPAAPPEPTLIGTPAPALAVQSWYQGDYVLPERG